MTDNQTIRLTRRRALGGLAAIGVASAGAGIGTSAYFSDQEAFEDNSIMAGEFGLEVEQEIHDIDQDGIGPDELEFDENEDDGVWAVDPIEITDAKPGDEYEFCWEITVLDNPGYVALAAESTDEDGVEAGNIDIDDLWDIDDEDDLETLGEVLEVEELVVENEDNDEEVDLTDEYDTLTDLLEDKEAGLVLEDDDGDAIEFDPDETWSLCVDLAISTDVGNEIQGATLEWDLAIYAEQQRHNDPEDVAENAVASLDQ